MMVSFKSIVTCVTLVASSLAAPLEGGVLSIRKTDDALRVNSGLCETTPGVMQKSGYFTVGEDINMWFWFFGARKNAANAPLVIWLNGGPGASSMLGLFQQNGPCHFLPGATSPSLNPHSFNEAANVLYIDQPVGTGFSFSNSPAIEESVNSTDESVKYLYEFLQAFYGEFKELKGRETGIFTASYGGRYGPALAKKIQDGNKKLGKKERINLTGLAINDGLFDYRIQHKAMIDFLLQEEQISEDLHDKTIADYNKKCVPALDVCVKEGSDKACAAADDACYETVEGPMGGQVDWVYDVRGREGNSPSEAYVEWLVNGTVQVKGKEVSVSEAIGAKNKYHATSNEVFNRFLSTGDTAKSSIAVLSEVVQSGLPVLMWVGDKDVICNYIGVRKVAENLTFSGQKSFTKKGLTDFKVKGDKTVYGEFKAEKNLSYLQIRDAGHYLMFYQPKASLEVLRQFMKTGTIKKA